MSDAHRDPEPEAEPDPEPQPTPVATPAAPVVFRVAPIAYFAPLMMMVTALVLAGTSLVYLGWTLLVPIVVAAWMVRIRTVVTADGLRAVGGLGTREVAWGDLDGLSFPRWGAVRAVLTDSTRVRLPAIAFRDLPRLSAASAGRIPDPYAPSPTE